MLKKLYISIICLLTLMGCRDDFDLPTPYGMDEDGTVQFNLSVPALQTVSTRANVDENNVKSLNILVFDGNERSSVLKAIVKDEEIELSSIGSEEDNSYRVSFKINNQALRNSASSLHFYFLANCYNEGLTEGSTTIESLSNFTTNVVNEEGFITMSGYATLNDGEVKLFRNGAKITVTDQLTKAESDGSLADMSKAYPFQTFASASDCKILSGIEDTILGSVSAVSEYPADLNASEANYVNPTDNTSGSAAAFVIVKAKFEKKDYFYRLDFKRVSKNESGEDKEEALNIKANHWYQFLIKSVNGPGSATPEDAAANPTPLIEYDIHDHSPVIYNMVSDGIRELGVNHELIYSGNPSNEDDWSGNTPIGIKLYIKVYSKNGDSDYEGLPDSFIIEGEEKWFELKNLKLSEQNLNGLDDPDEVKDEGKVYEAEVWFYEPDDFGELEGELTISWHGLSRKIPVRWERSFDTSSLITASLRIYDETANQENYGTTGLVETITDYFCFLASEDVVAQSTDDTPLLYGVKPTSNNQKIRNEGFHFPVMYGHRAKAYNGKKESRWSYVYDVKLKDDNALRGVTFDWKLEVSGSTTITDYVKVNGETRAISGTHEAGQPWSFTLTRLGNALDVDGSSMSGGVNDYTYGTGELTLTIVPYNDGVAGAPQKYTFDLYHTGFFHKNEYTNHRVDVTTPDNAYYYYEVVPIMGASRMRYWLDRNLGAKSAGLYIQATGEVTYYGDVKAAGGYYRAGEYSSAGKPIMYDTNSDQSSRVSPPGYRVPMQKVWNALRNSTNFDTDAIGGYFNSCYHSSVGDVFFPKSRYIDATGSHVGESRAGYFWTSTEASGTEKEETGRWLKVLNISGTTTSYINGAVYSTGKGFIVKKDDNTTEDRGDDGYAMSVRCINDIDDSSTPSRTSLVVAGATHVYLYRIDKTGTRIATTTWPGHVIGNSYTMSDPNNWFEFSYESDNLQPEDFYVIFNFVDSYGKIHSMGKNTTLENATSMSPSQIEGWSVVGDESFTTLEPGIHESYKAVPTENEYYWRCYYSQHNKVYCYNAKPSSEEKTITHTFRLWWPAEMNVDGTYRTYDKIWVQDGYNGNAAYAYIDDVKFFYVDIKQKNLSSSPVSQSITFLVKDVITGSGNYLKPGGNNVGGDNVNMYIENIFDSNTSVLESDGRYHRTMYTYNNSVIGSPKVETKYRVYWPYSGNYNTLRISCQMKSGSPKYFGGQYNLSNPGSGDNGSKFGDTSVSNKTFAYVDFSIDADEVTSVNYTLSNSTGYYPSAVSPSLNFGEFKPVVENNIRYLSYTLTSDKEGYAGSPSYQSFKHYAFFDNSISNWDTPKAYVWEKNNSSIVPLGDWPGKEMVRLKENIWWIGFNNELSEPMVIFSNNYNQNNKTDNLDFEDKALYNKNGKKSSSYNPLLAPRRKARSINQAKSGRR